jgi:hypothetical protein
MEPSQLMLVQNGDSIEDSHAIACAIARVASPRRNVSGSLITGCGFTSQSAGAFVSRLGVEREQPS